MTLSHQKLKADSRKSDFDVAKAKQFLATTPPPRPAEAPPEKQELPDHLKVILFIFIC